MGRTVSALGWILAVIATVFWLWGYNANRPLESQLQELTAQHEQTLLQIKLQEDQIDALSGDFSDISGQLEQANLTTGMLEDSLQSLIDEAADPRDDLASTNDVGSPEHISSAEETSEEEQTKKANPFAEMFGEMSDDMILATTKMNVETQYGEFFGWLDADTAEQARLIITQILQDQTKQGLGLMRGESSADDIAAVDYEQWMRDELANILTPEYQAAFDEYQATLQERMMERNYEMQLSMYASGLSPENHDMVLDVLVEEMLRLGDESAATSLSTTDPGGEFARLIDVYGRVRARFEGVLDEGQQSILERFLEQQESMLEMMLPMMESMMDSLETTP